MTPYIPNYYGSLRVMQDLYHEQLDRLYLISIPKCLCLYLCLNHLYAVPRQSQPQSPRPFPGLDELREMTWEKLAHVDPSAGIELFPEMHIDIDIDTDIDRDRGDRYRDKDTDTLTM